MYFVLLGHKTHKQGIQIKNFEATLKSSMQAYRHLFHPFRLSIMQMLYSSSKIPASEIKNRLEMSWSDYYSAIRTLEKLRLIYVYDDFDEDGGSRQFVRMEEKGAREYSEFVEIIQSFVGVAKENLFDYGDVDLYPQD